METKTKTETINNKNSIVNKDSSINKASGKIILFLILIVGIIFSLLLFLTKIYVFQFDWKIPFIPIMIAIQIVFLVMAIKSRYKKH